MFDETILGTRIIRSWAKQRMAKATHSQTIVPVRSRNMLAEMNDIEYNDFATAFLCGSGYDTDDKVEYGDTVVNFMCVAFASPSESVLGPLRTSRTPSA